MPGGPFKPGPDPRRNAGGRPKALRNVIALARKRTVRAIRALTEIMLSSEDDGARVKAAAILLERGWGKPLQSIRKTVTHVRKSPRELTLEELERRLSEISESHH